MLLLIFSVIMFFRVAHCGSPPLSVNSRPDIHLSLYPFESHCSQEGWNIIIKWAGVPCLIKPLYLVQFYCTVPDTFHNNPSN